MEKLARLWRTWRALRDIDTKGAEMLRASAERDHKAIQNIERHTKEQRENMSRLVEGALESVHLLTAKQEAETAERLKAYHKQISSLQPESR